MSTTSLETASSPFQQARSALDERVAKLRELQVLVNSKHWLLRRLANHPGFVWDKKISIGVCAMEKKSMSKPMKLFLSGLPEDFEITVFEERMILDDPIQCWPVCDCLIAFASKGFPLDKCIAYAEYRKPFLVNDLVAQKSLTDRRTVYKICEANAIPVPNYVVVNRDEDGVVPDFFEGDDFIEVGGKRISKPFVEKPVDSDSHDVFVYYPRASGGGRKELFRKVDNRSSEFYPDRNNIRRDGSYIYEEFLSTEGTDVKVYTATANYAHAEARKSPVMDGRVMRDEKNAEIRYPVMLNPVEKEIAARVVKAFKQEVCGFDLLRSAGRSYVCDVNGWSFVKHSPRYHKDSSMMLARLLRQSIKRRYGIDSADDDEENKMYEDETNDEDEDDLGDLYYDVHGGNTTLGEGGDALSSSLPKMSSLGMMGPTAASLSTSYNSGGAYLSAKPPHAQHRHEELRAVIAIIRHGDRTPKQKLKMMVTDARFLGLFSKYGGGGEGGKQELKLKTAKELSDVLRIIHEITEELYRQSAGTESDAQMDLYAQARAVLEMHGSFRGINRKVQLKVTKSDPDTRAPTEAQVIIKWGGVLTPQGRERAEQLGRSFREKMYPGKDGLLRLHSTYRHDLKIYASDEGRVQVTAAAFAKGLLDLEGHLTPILESLVKKGDDINTLLHDATKAAPLIVRAKASLKSLLTAPFATQAEFQQWKDRLPKSVQNALESLSTLSVPAKKPDANEEEEDDDEDENEDQRKPNKVLENPMIPSLTLLHQKVVSLATQLRQQRHSNFALRGSVTATIGWGVERVAPTDGGAAAHSLGGTVADADAAKIDRGDGAITITDMFTLAHARWEKLANDFFKKGTFDISKIPDIYDSAKYDATHNPELWKLRPTYLLSVFELSKALADAVVPQEYGETAIDKFDVGAHTCQALLEKIREDLCLAAGEGAAIPDDDASGAMVGGNGGGSGASGGSNGGGSSVDGGGASHSLLPSPTHHESSGSREDSTSSNPNHSSSSNNNNNTTNNNDDAMSTYSTTLAAASTTSGGTDNTYRLDKKLAKSMGIKNMNRHVRTRLYFTSESHVHAVMNVLRFAFQADPSLPRPSDSVLRRLAADVEELSYLSHIVLRLFEVTLANGSKTHILRVYLSDGIRFSVEKPLTEDVDVKVTVGPGPSPDSPSILNIPGDHPLLLQHHHESASSTLDASPSLTPLQLNAGGGWRSTSDLPPPSIRQSVHHGRSSSYTQMHPPYSTNDGGGGGSSGVWPAAGPTPPPYDGPKMLARNRSSTLTTSSLNPGGSVVPTPSSSSVKQLLPASPMITLWSQLALNDALRLLSIDMDHVHSPPISLSPVTAYGSSSTSFTASAPPPSGKVPIQRFNSTAHDTIHWTPSTDQLSELIEDHYRVVAVATARDGESAAPKSDLDVV